jgi:hypothetical protein
MDDIYKVVLLYAFVPSVIGIGSYFMKSIHTQLNTMEKDLVQKMSEEDVRRLLNDCVVPIRQDISELRTQVDKIIDVLIEKK